MSREDHERELKRLTDAATAPVNGQLAVIDSRIRQFELRYQMTSAVLMQRLEANTYRETAEVAEWLFLLDTRHRVAG